MTRLITNDDVSDARFSFILLCWVSVAAVITVCMDPAAQLILWLMGITQGFHIPTSPAFYLFVFLVIIILRMTVRRFHTWQDIQEQYDHQFKEIETLEPKDFNK